MCPLSDGDVVRAAPCFLLLFVLTVEQMDLHPVYPAGVFSLLNSSPVIHTNQTIRRPCPCGVAAAGGGRGSRCPGTASGERAGRVAATVGPRQHTQSSRTPRGVRRTCGDSSPRNLWNRGVCMGAAHLSVDGRTSLVRRRLWRGCRGRRECPAGSRRLRGSTLGGVPGRLQRKMAEHLVIRVRCLPQFLVCSEGRRTPDSLLNILRLKLVSITPPS